MTFFASQPLSTTFAAQTQDLHGQTLRERLIILLRSALHLLTQTVLLCLQALISSYLINNNLTYVI